MTNADKRRAEEDVATQAEVIAQIEAALQQVWEQFSPWDTKFMEALHSADDELYEALADQVTAVRQVTGMDLDDVRAAVYEADRWTRVLLRRTSDVIERQRASDDEATKRSVAALRNTVGRTPQEAEVALRLADRLSVTPMEDTA